MNVFVTGASGWIGSAVIPQLLAAGHHVVGLARSDDAAAAVAALGAEVRRGDLDDLDGLRAGTEESDGVIHLGFKHDATDFADAGRTERAAVETLCKALEGSDRPFLLAAGIALLAPGRVLTERDATPMVGPEALRGGAEELALSYAERGVRSVSLRFALTVHGEGDHGFVPTLVGVARERGTSGYVGAGENAGRRCTGWTRPGWCGRRWSDRRPARWYTGWPRRACRPAPSPRRSGAGSVSRSGRSTRTTPPGTSAGSACSSPSTRRPRARSPGTGWTGRLPTRG
jgi:putative NADH-flavin reductase